MEFQWEKLTKNQYLKGKPQAPHLSLINVPKRIVGELYVAALICIP